jgi:hypothetical protein
MNSAIGLKDACEIQHLLSDNRLLGPCVSAGHLVIVEVNVPIGTGVDDLVGVLKRQTTTVSASALHSIPSHVRRYPDGSLKMDLRFDSQEDANKFVYIAKAGGIPASASLTAATNAMRSLSAAGILRVPVSILQEIIVEVTLDATNGMSREDCVLLVTDGTRDSQDPARDLLVSSLNTKEDGSLVLRLLMPTPLEASLLLAAVVKLVPSAALGDGANN